MKTRGHNSIQSNFILLPRSKGKCGAKAFCENVVGGWYKKEKHQTKSVHRLVAALSLTKKDEEKFCLVNLTYDQIYGLLDSIQTLCKSILNLWLAKLIREFLDILKMVITF